MGVKAARAPLDGALVKNGEALPGASSRSSGKDALEGEDAEDEDAEEEENEETGTETMGLANCVRVDEEEGESGALPSPAGDAAWGAGSVTVWPARMLRYLTRPAATCSRYTASMSDVASSLLCGLSRPGSSSSSFFFFLRRRHARQQMPTQHMAAAAAPTPAPAARAAASALDPAGALFSPPPPPPPPPRAGAAEEEADADGGGEVEAVALGCGAANTTEMAL